MEEGGRTMSMTLPEDIVIKIMAMVPFPFIYRARALSRSWQTVFQPISSIDDEERKRLAISFQKQVRQWSGNWKTFCPVYWSGAEGMAYDGTSHSWRRLPSLSYLPQGVRNNYSVQMDGALVLIISREGKMNSPVMHVANVLNQSWKRLPDFLPFPRQIPIMRRSRDPPIATMTKLVRGISVEVYKVIIFHAQQGADWIAQVYNSKSNDWNWKTFEVPRRYVGVNYPSAYLDGVLYITVQENHLARLLAFNVEEETMQEIKMPSIDVKFFELVACGGSVWIVAYNHSLYSEDVTVLKVDLAEGISKVSDGPPAALEMLYILSRPVGDGHRIVWKVTDREGNPSDKQRRQGTDRCVLEYDVVRDVWSVAPFHCLMSMEWHDFSFQPGLNPFAPV